jgi:hypothetical protein
MSFVTLDKARSALKTPAAPSRSGKSSRTLPSVNLLSPATLEHIAVSHLRKRFLAGGLAVAVVLGGGWLLQTQRLHSAQDRLAAEQAATPALTAQVQALAPVSQFYAAVDQRKQTASAAMAAEVLFSEALTDLAKLTPAGMTIQTMSVTLTPDVVVAQAPPVSPLTQAGIDGNGNDTTKNAATNGTGASGLLGAPAKARAAADAASAAGAARATTPTPAAPAADAVACARPDPFNPARVIGCVTITGTADSRAVVGDLINKLKASDLYADPFVTTTTAGGAAGEQSVQFSGSVGLTGKNVSGRYADLSWLANPDVLAEAERLIKAGQTASVKLARQSSHQAAVAKAKAEAEAKAKAAAEAAAQKAAEDAAKAQIQAAALAAAQAAALANAAAQGNAGGMP